MKNIPSGLFLIVAATSGIVISITINEDVPDGLKHLDEQRLSKRDPDIINDEVTASKVLQVEIRGVTNGLRMFGETTEEYCAGEAFSPNPPFLPPSGIAFPT
jgi:hypothetical protein